MENTLYIDDPNNSEDGRILGYLMCSSATVNQQEQPDGIGLFQGIGGIPAFLDATHYMDVNTMKPRPEITATPTPTNLEITANGSDLFMLTGLPEPCTVTVTDNNVETADTVTEVTDGEFGFPTSYTGTYTVTVESFPYQPKSWEVTAI